MDLETDKTPKYGTVVDTTQIDDNGSEMELERTFKDGVVVPPTRRRYAIRVKVHNDQEELTEHLKFKDEAKQGQKYDIATRLERSRVGDQQGFYYFVKCWTELIR